ncbi:MAG TPA: MBL fold metallo-hydrolase, partial [Spirochaetota bacterium]|nr:MBL fold metallo-hydrolase [Spirochaetota bacterium]
MSFIKISVLMVGVSLILLVINMIIKANEAENKFKYNPELEFIIDYPGNPVDKNGRFVNEPPTTLSGFTDIIKWKFSDNPQEEEKKNENYSLPVKKGCDFLEEEKDVIVWLGHASFFIRLNGVSMLIDPVFDKATVVPRLAGNACDISNYKNIDYLLISHNHRDHLDIPTIAELYKNNPYIHALIPLEMGK